MSEAVTPKTTDPKASSLAYRPRLWLSEVFVYFLQNLFRDVAPAGSGFHWAPDALDATENTEIIITAEKPKLDAIGKTPHVVCVLGAARWSGIGLDQLQKLQFATGKRTHTDLIPCTVTYHCQAKEGLVAGDLAWLCSFYTNAYRRAIMKGGGLHHVGVQHEISSESPASAYSGPLVNSEIVSVKVTVPFFWQPQWTATPQGVSLFNKMKMHLRTEMCGLSSGRQAHVNPPQYKGKPVISSTPLDQEVREEKE
jgi:hypothetical protein